MNKQVLISMISSEAAITQKQATAALDALIEGVSETLRKGGKITFVEQPKSCLPK